MKMGGVIVCGDKQFTAGISSAINQSSNVNILTESVSIPDLIAAIERQGVAGVIMPATKEWTEIAVRLADTKKNIQFFIIGNVKKDTWDSLTEAGVLVLSADMQRAAMSIEMAMERISLTSFWYTDFNGIKAMTRNKPDSGTNDCPQPADLSQDAAPETTDHSLSVDTNKTKLCSPDLTYDALTNVFDRKTMDTVLNNLDTENISYSLIMYDLDCFKKINDTYGHAVGDEVLKSYAAHLKLQLRNEEIIARYGGEEFVVILPKIPKEQAFNIADRIRKSWQEKKMYYSTVSGGVADNEHNSGTAQEVLKAADKSLYIAKKNGRNQICMPGQETRAVIDEAFVPSRYGTVISENPIKVVVAVKPRVIAWATEIGLHPKIKVLATADMRTAIKKALVIGADALVLSYAMDMFVTDAARRVKEVLPNCKIFTVTDFNSEEIRNKCNNAGVVLLNKQSKPSEIAETIIEQCGQDCHRNKPGANRIQIILVHGLYEKCGCTTLALNITAALKSRPEYRFSKIAYLDLAGHYKQAINVNWQAIGPDTTPGEMESFAATTLACGANVFPAPDVKPEQVDWVMERYIHALANYHSAIIIDSGKYMVTRQATHLIIVTLPKENAITALKGTLQLLDPPQIQKTKVVLNRCNEIQVIDKLQDIERPICVIPEDSTGRFDYQQKQLVEIAPNSAFSTAIGELVQSIVVGENRTNDANLKEGDQNNT